MLSSVLSSASARADGPQQAGRTARHLPLAAATSRRVHARLRAAATRCESRHRAVISDGSCVSNLIDNLCCTYLLLTVSGGPDRGVAKRAAQRHPQQAVSAQRRVREGGPEALHAAQHGQQGRHWTRYVPSVGRWHGSCLRKCLGVCCQAHSASANMKHRGRHSSRSISIDALVQNRIFYDYVHCVLCACARHLCTNAGTSCLQRWWLRAFFWLIHERRRSYPSWWPTI